jgi:hypothetical protein
MSVFRITVLICCPSEILCTDKMRLLTEVSSYWLWSQYITLVLLQRAQHCAYLNLHFFLALFKASKCLHIQTQLPIKGSCIC